ncbi:response regulator transcription factor [Microbacterium sp. lyk4-40-TSB-66]|uniref:response regulator transcription factor n=1 Tax=Microbacterium sp. lyk4-40-TSB-66 TaxID=3040294 RepID=UPI00254EF97E|nr:response regulator transcription factor [Microbacterium sp. lyk4-40-TSB-66]
MAARPSVVIVEDDDTVRTVVADYLRADGYDVVAYGDGATALAALASGVPDVLVLDRMLPGVSGDELCHEVRSRSDVPVLMLTARAGVDDRIDGLERGADDYLTKPFAMRELQLRVRALLRRRVRADGSSDFSVGPFRVDPVRRRVWNGADEVPLTAREYDLLLHLARHPDRVFTRDELLHAVWGWTFGEASTVTVHVRRLREKIEPDPHSPVHLRTVWGAGYRFVPGGVVRAVR